MKDSTHKGGFCGDGNGGVGLETITTRTVVQSKGLEFVSDTGTTISQVSSDEETCQVMVSSHNSCEMSEGHHITHAHLDESRQKLEGLT